MKFQQIVKELDYLVGYTEEVEDLAVMEELDIYLGMMMVKMHGLGELEVGMEEMEEDILLEELQEEEDMDQVLMETGVAVEEDISALDNI